MAYIYTRHRIGAIKETTKRAENQSYLTYHDQKSCARGPRKLQDMIRLASMEDECNHVA